MFGILIFFKHSIICYILLIHNVKLGRDWYHINSLWRLAGGVLETVVFRLRWSKQECSGRSITLHKLQMWTILHFTEQTLHVPIATLPSSTAFCTAWSSVYETWVCTPQRHSTSSWTGEAATAVRLANFSSGLSSVRGRLAKGRWRTGNKTGGIKRKVLQQ